VPSSSSARPSRRRANAAKALALAGLTLATTGACRVDVNVGIQSDADGTGRVRIAATLDRSAVEQLVGQAAGDPDAVDPATRIKVDDLRKAGWTIDGPTETADGGLDVVATHRFANAAEARALVDDVGGDPGPFRDVRLRQERTFFKTRTEFRGTVDLGKRLGAFTDPELRQALEATDDAPLGITDAQLEQRLGAALDRLFGLHVAVRLPGDLTASNAPTATDNGAVWTPSLGETVRLEAASERWNVGNLVALAAALAAAAALVTLLLQRRHPASTVLTVTDGNIKVDDHGQTGADGRGA
jgi:hypothetical protein